MEAQNQKPQVGFVDPDVGPYSLYWLHEDGEPDGLKRGLSLERAFGALMAAANIEHSFERIDGVMMLLLDEGAYRVTSKLHVDEDAKREIMRAAVKHAWGEYSVRAE